MARSSYQSGLPFLVHNFGTFGAIFTYTLFDGGEREAKLLEARIKLTMAQTQLKQIEADVSIELSSSYDKVEQLEQLVSVTTQDIEAREESFRIQSERAKVDAQLASGVVVAHAALTSAHMNVLNSQLNLSLARNSMSAALGIAAGMTSISTISQQERCGRVEDILNSVRGTSRVFPFGINQERVYVRVCILRTLMLGSFCLCDFVSIYVTCLKICVRLRKHLIPTTVRRQRIVSISITD